MTTNKAQISRKQRGWFLFFLCFGVFMIYLDGTIVNVALPQIQIDMNVGLKQLQWVIDAYAITFACLLLTAGTIGDAIGHKKVFIAGLIGFTLSSALCAISPAMDILLIGRALQGIFGSLLIPVSLAVIRNTYEDPAERAKAIGIWAGLGGVALAAGPVIGGWLVDAQGWQSIFWINIPFGILVTIALLFNMKGSVARRTHSFDLLGQILFIACIASLTYALIEGNSLGWNSPAILLSFAVSGISLLLFALWELRHPNPLLPMNFFRNPIFIVVCMVNFFGFFGLFSVIFLLTLYLQNINGLSAIDTGVRFLSLTASIMVASIVGSSLAARISPRIMIPAGSLMVGAGLAALTNIEAGSSYGSYWWALALLGIGVSLAGTSATVALMTSIAPERAGAASGIANTFRQISAVVGVALSGTLVSERMNSASSSPSEPLTGLNETGARLFVEGMHASLILAAIGSLACAIATLVILNRVSSRRTTPVALDNQ